MRWRDNKLAKISAIKLAVISVLLFTMLIIAITVAADDTIKLKIAVINPSTTTEQVTPVRFDLPKGVDPKAIVDIGDMELKYDSDKGTYYVYQKVTLKPSEKKILAVKLQDIWIIPEKDVAFLKNHNDALVKKLKGTKHTAIGAELFKNIEERLNEVAKSQADITLSTNKKINLYYENAAALAEIKKSIGMLENLVIDIGGVVEERVDIPTTLAVSVKAEEAAAEDTIDLNIKMTNPSKKNKQITPLKYDLPQEVTPKYIADNAGLDVAYNFAKECFYVCKDSVQLEPDETRTFVVKIKDVWKIPEAEIESLQSHTNNLMLLLKGTEYMSQATPIADKIFSNLDGVVKSQSLKVGASEHIGYYRNNTLTMSETKRYVAQLEKIVSQSGITPGVTIAKAERLKGGGPEVKRKRGYEGITFIAESIFRGKAPNVATTWKIIFIILAFVGIVGIFFFFLWYVQVGKREKK